MMSSAGSIAAMITTLRNNKKLLRTRSLFKKERRFLQVKKEDYKAAAGVVVNKKVAPEVLQKIRTQIISERRWAYRKGFIAFGALLLIVFIGYHKNTDAIVSFVTYPYPTEKRDPGMTPLEKYHFFITDGDKMLQEKHWHNAIFQYKEALKLFPQEYDANYRLALAYSYKCLDINVGCAEGLELTNELLAKTTATDELLLLKKQFKEKLQH